MVSIIVLLALVCGAIAIIFGYPVWKVLVPVLFLPLLVCTVSVAIHQLGVMSFTQALGLSIVLFVIPPFVKGLFSGLKAIAETHASRQKNRLSSAKIERLPAAEVHTDQIRALGPGTESTESSSWDG